MSSESADPEEGLEGFLSGLRRCGCTPEIRNDVVVFTVVPVGGGRAGVTTESGVAVDELTMWPAAPPHWVHLPGDVEFARTNSRASTRPGWLKHSREPRNWGNAEEPAQAWIAHVRGMLEEAL